MARLHLFQDNSYLVIFTNILLLTCTCISGHNDGDEHERLSEHSSGYITDLRQFRVLEILERCKYINLTRCHKNPGDHSNYQSYCLDGACKENETYYCLNGPNNNTIHTCGPTKRCNKRHMDVFQHEKNVKGETLKVFTIQCAAGYFQPAYFWNYNWNCFTKCEKDESVVIIQNATNDRPALGRCNSHNNYCNGYNLTVFELGSSKDHCPHAKFDLNIRCDEEEELLPNCTCAIKCNVGTIRDWNGSLSCISHSASQRGTDVHITDSKTKRTSSSYHLSSEITSQDKGENNQMSKKTKDASNKNQDHSDIKERKHTVVTLRVELIAVFVVVAGIFILVIWLLRRKVCVVLSPRKKCRRQVEDGNERPEFSSTGTDQFSIVMESISSISTADTTLNRTKQNRSPKVFKRAQNNEEQDKSFTDLRTREKDSHRIPNKKDGTSSRSDTTQKVVYPNNITREAYEREHLLADYSNDEDRPYMSNVRYFKKPINDTNTQAEVRCLSNNMLSCGGIVYLHRVIGSAFRVGPKYVITAFHVIRDIVRDLTGNSNYDFTLLEVQNLTINFNDSVLNQHKRDIQLKYRYHDAVCDCVVLEIKDVDSHENLPKPLLLWNHDISHMKGKQVTLIGYGNVENPNEKHGETCVIIKENAFTTRYREALASLRQNAQEYKNSIPDNDKSSVDRGYIGVENDAFIKFDCFMEKGLSGGPVITNEGHSSKVIGLVKGGMPDFYYELSPEKKGSFEKKYLFEVGVKMQKIYDTMIREDPVLASELFP